MASLLTEHQQWFDETTGTPINNGYIYIGTLGLDPTVLANRKTLYSDSALTTAITNPQRTGPDGRSVNKIYVATGFYSIEVQDSAGVQKYVNLNNGATSASGSAFPEGGTTGQILIKQSATNGDATWQTPADAGIGSVTITSGEFCPGYVFTRVSNTSIVSSADIDLQNLFSDGRRVKVQDTTAKYGIVSSTTYSSGTGTTINLTMESGATIDSNPTNVCLVSSTSAWSPIATDPFGGTAIIAFESGMVGATHYTVAVGSGSKIYYSTDAGVTWTAGTSPTANEITSIVYFDSIETFVIGETSRQPYYSEDGGATWTAVSTASLAIESRYGQTVKREKFSGVEYLSIYITFTVETLDVSNLASGTWVGRPDSDILFQGEQHDTEAFFHRSSGFRLAYSEAGNDLRVTYTNGGINSSEFSSNITADNGYLPGNAIKDMAENVSVSSLIVGTQGHLFTHFSVGSPTSATERTSSFGTTDINSAAHGNVGGLTSTYVAVGGASKIAYSLDEGVTWTQVANGFNAIEDIEAVHFVDHPTDPVFIAGGASGTICRSTNGIS